MKKLLTAAAFAALMTAPAFAADLSTKDAASSPSVAGVSLSGVVVELGLGAGVANASVSQGSAGADASFAGFLGDIRVRVERVVTPGWNASVYAGLSIEDVKGNTSGFTAGNQTFGYSAGVQIGRTFNSGTSEIYGLAGYQGQHLGLNGTGYSTDLQGIALGGGIRTALSAHLVAGVEIQEVIYGAYKPVTGVNIDNTEMRTTARIGYKF